MPNVQLAAFMISITILHIRFLSNVRSTHIHHIYLGEEGMNQVCLEFQKCKMFLFKDFKNRNTCHMCTSSVEFRTVKRDTISNDLM